MIRYYCQFSYGGFKTFRINGESHEALTQEVTAEQKFDFPDLGDLYFNHGGAKVLYRYLDKDTLSLIIREIPGPGQDTDGRNINCAIQFIGAAEDRDIMDRLCIKVVNDIHLFESEFADMFDLRGGLFFEGDRLSEFVLDCLNPCSYEGESKLLKIIKRTGTVLFFVPFSSKFGFDEKTTTKVIDELKLSNEATDPQIMMSIYELEKIQNFIEIKPIKPDDPIMDDESSEGHPSGDDCTVEKLKVQLEQTKKELEKKAEECFRLRNSAINTSKELEVAKAANEDLRSKGKFLLYFGGGLLGFSLLMNLLHFFF